METKKSLTYLRAKKKVETLKGFYEHLTAYVAVNAVIILTLSNVFSSREINFADFGNYGLAFFWGFGLVSHAIYVFFVLNVQNNFLKRWEEKKINQFLEDD